MPASCDCVRRRRRQMSTDFAWSSISKFHVVECDRAQLRFCRNGSAPLSEAYLAAGRPYRSSGVPKKKRSKACVCILFKLLYSDQDQVDLTHPTLCAGANGDVLTQ